MAEIQGSDYLLGDVMEIIKMELEAMEEGSTTLVPVIVGDPGIGKSASMASLAKLLGYEVHIISLGALPMEALSGLPDFKIEIMDPAYSMSGSEEVKTTEWTMADVIRTINVKTEAALASGKKGLLVLLDDIHLVEPMVQKYLFEFFQNKTLQNYRAHEKAHFVGAMNGKDSAGLESFISAVLNRMALYKTKFDKDYWYKHVGYTLHPYVASFASGPNDKYFSGANATDGASPSPRTWTELSQIISYAEKVNEGQPSQLNRKLQMMAEARVGREATVEFMKHVKLFQKFDFANVLKKKDPNFKVSEDISDQILTAFIIRYMKDPSDADYLIDVVLKNNTTQRTFISIFINEFDILRAGIPLMQEGQSKKALEHINDIITDEKRVGSDLIDIVVDSLLDVT